jgi:hypothetical protein
MVFMQNRVGAPVTEDFREVVHEALNDFWSRVAKTFPDNRGGDLSPERSIALETAALHAVEEWWNNNCKDQI